MSEAYFVPCCEAESEFTEKRSRFIGHVCHVESEADARAYIDMIKKRCYDARHNCWCYVIHEGGVVRYGDDGEPQGTAGQPMLNVFQREGVENVVCVVTRYFGGVLLGAGGLTRAYSKSAKDALDAAGKARMALWSRLRVSVPYALLERLTRLAEAHGGVTESSDYGAEVAVGLRFPKENIDAFSAALTELSGGAVSPEMLGEVFMPGNREESL
ncbi:MAG: YigZ family protein [Oscillospiraceae bacterium]|nr:YigZ family protein [Oscillospiraceae bacterium]